MTHNQKFSASDIADYYLALSNESGESITNLKLQKLVFYAQAWYLANFGVPLFEDDFQAWVHGPVIPDLYKKYKMHGYGPIPSEVTLEIVSKKFNPEVVAFLNEVAGVYMTRGGFELEAMTHQERPWIDARGNREPDESCDEIIPKTAMKEFYGQRLKDQAN